VSKSRFGLRRQTYGQPDFEPAALIHPFSESYSKIPQDQPRQAPLFPPPLLFLLGIYPIRTFSSSTLGGTINNHLVRPPISAQSSFDFRFRFRACRS
jgi:hypothetical protein